MLLYSNYNDRLYTSGPLFQHVFLVILTVQYSVKCDQFFARAVFHYYINISHIDFNDLGIYRQGQHSEYFG